MTKLGEKIINLEGKTLYYSTYYQEFVRDYQFCSEHFFCNGCLRDKDQLVKGITRYDSLVLCEEHNNKFKPIVKQLNDIIDRSGAQRIHDLGL